MTTEKAISFFEHQLENWGEARERYENLKRAEQRKIKIDGDFEITLQWNPARIVSTGADLSKEYLKKRKCFLCSENRPSIQNKIEIKKDWDLLVNPFPIFNPHFTIVRQTHAEQGEMPIEMIEFSKQLPGLVIFFNGAEAGASAPDHSHLQGVSKENLPLIKLIEKIHTDDKKVFLSSKDFFISPPFQFFTASFIKDTEPEKAYLEFLRFTISQLKGAEFNHRKSNSFFWTGPDNRLRGLIIPRMAHRPSAYFAEGEEKRLVSPGAIDMAGAIILPRKEDFEALTAEELKKIYNETGISPK